MIKKSNLIFTNLHGKSSTSIENSKKRGDWKSTKDFLKLAPQEIIDIVKNSGLRGRGGAGFSTGMKWDFMPKIRDKQHYLVINADEGEPGTCKDRDILRNEPHKLLEGCLIAGYAIGASNVIFILEVSFIMKQKFSKKQ